MLCNNKINNLFYYFVFDRKIKLKQKPFRESYILLINSNLKCMLVSNRIYRIEMDFLNNSFKPLYFYQIYLNFTEYLRLDRKIDYYFYSTKLSLEEIEDYLYDNYVVNYKKILDE